LRFNIKETVLRWLIQGLLLLALSGCQYVQKMQAPVLRLDDAPFKPGGYVAVKGDTIYAIAWRYHLDYEALAVANKIRAPYTINPGQIIKLTEVVASEKAKVNVTQIESHQVYTNASKQKKSSKFVAKINKKIAIIDKHLTMGWFWPVEGKIIQSFNPSKRQNGLTFRAKPGARVVAGTAGLVVYVGDTIRGYGHLILIKHSRSLISAYAGDQHVIRKIGETIHRGETIAYVMQQKVPKVHFELRVDGKPKNPLLYLAVKPEKGNKKK
jgi:lipoprotein NlpD